MEAQTRHEVTQSIVDQFFDSALDDDLAEIVVRVRSQSPVSEAEALRLNWWLRARFRYWEDVHYQYRLGLYDEDEFVAQTQALIGMSGFDDVRDFWRTNKFAFSAEFMDYVDEVFGSSTMSE